MRRARIVLGRRHCARVVLGHTHRARVVLRRRHRVRIVDTAEGRALSTRHASLVSACRGQQDPRSVVYGCGVQRITCQKAFGKKTKKGIPGVDVAKRAGALREGR